MTFPFDLVLVAGKMRKPKTHKKHVKHPRCTQLHTYTTIKRYSCVRFHPFVIQLCLARVLSFRHSFRPQTGEAAADRAGEAPFGLPRGRFRPAGVQFGVRSVLKRGGTPFGAESQMGDIY